MTLPPPAVAGVRALTAAQFALVAGYLAGLAMFLRAYADADGDIMALRGGAHDPKDLVPLGMHLANPFAWAYGAVSLSVLAGWLLSAAMVVVAVPTLALTRSRVSARAWWWLLTATTAGIMLVAVTFSPFGALFGTWMAD